MLMQKKLSRKNNDKRSLALTKYKKGQIIQWGNSIFKVVGFEGGKDGIPLLNEVKVLVQFD